MFVSWLIDQVHDFWATSVVILIGTIVSFSPARCMIALLSWCSSWQMMILEVSVAGVLVYLLSKLPMVSYAIYGLPNVVRTIHAYV